MRNVGGTRITSDPTKRAAADKGPGAGSAPRTRTNSGARRESRTGATRAESADRRAKAPALVVDADRFRRSENLERGARPLHPDQRAGQLEQDAAPLGRGLGQPEQHARQRRPMTVDVERNRGAKITVQAD